MGNEFATGYQPIVLPDMSEGISKIGDALTYVLDKRRQEKQFNEKMAFEREQENRKFKAEQDQLGIQNRAADRLETRDIESAAQKTSAYREQQREKLQRAVASGNPQEVAAIAGETYTGLDDKRKPIFGSATQAPSTFSAPEPVALPPGSRPTDAVDPAALAAARGKAVAPQAPLQGPIQTPQGVADTALADVPHELGGAMPEIRARQRALEARRQEMQAERDKEVADPGRYDREFAAYRSEADQHNAQRALDLFDYPAKQAEARGAQRTFDANNAPGAVSAAHDKWLADKTTAQNEAPWTVNLGGSPFTVDTQSARYTTRTADANDFLHSLPPNLPPTAQSAAAQAHAAILAGMPLKDALLGFQKAVTTGQAFEFKAGEAVKDRETKIRVAEIGATKPSFAVQERGQGHREEEDAKKRVEENIKAWEKTNGATDLGAQMHEADKTLDMIKGNSREQQGAILHLLRSDVGKGNRLNQFEVQHFGVDSGLSAGDSIADRLEKLWSGGRGEEASRLAREAAAHIQRSLRERAASMADEGRRSFVRDPQYKDASDYADAFLSQQIPGYVRNQQPPPDPAARAAVGRSRSKKVTGLTDEQLQKLLDKNP